MVRPSKLIWINEIICRARWIYPLCCYLEDNMKLRSLGIAICASLLLPLSASAQGIIGGAQEGASKGAREGSKAAGPIGGAVGTVVGGTAGAVTGGVKGAVGAPSTTKKKKKQID